MEQPEDTDKLREEAIAWLVRLHAPGCNEAERRACNRWLAESPRHRAAYAQAEAQWRWMEQFKSQRFRAREDALRYRPKNKLTPKRLVIFATAASLLLFCGMIVLRLGGWYDVGTRYIAAKGEREVVVLDDGSRLELNTDSEIKVHLNRWRRSVELVRGEVYFNVTHDGERPFEVQAGGGRTTDIGTAFEVYLQPETVLVAVQEGRVRVEARGSCNLAAGQQITYNRRGEFSMIPAREIADLTAWRQGRMVFHDRPLSEVLSEIGRYHDISIRISDAKQRNLRVSGAFRTASLDAILNTITSTLPVKVERINEHEVLLKPLGKKS
ncbi:FecR family protein [Candidatus Methylospira mobilis]|uniref:FecR family protein n=1 Tax=Candidatus Methylospira mobilis TaxID=1808979 RepID=UPI0028EB5EAE|nr:FecR family protein [Candidatus Methylospira mobilis]WNV03773.1 FecR family protein [Candidatus Methylospira mobilis]